MPVTRLRILHALTCMVVSTLSAATVTISDTEPLSFSSGVGYSFQTNNQGVNSGSRFSPTAGSRTQVYQLSTLVDYSGLGLNPNSDLLAATLDLTTLGSQTIAGITRVLNTGSTNTSTLFLNAVTGTHTAYLTDLRFAVPVTGISVFSFGSNVTGVSIDLLDPDNSLLLNLLLANTQMTVNWTGRVHLTAELVPPAIRSGNQFRYPNNVNQTYSLSVPGVSQSLSGALAVTLNETAPPPPEIPEPATWALMGTALVSVAVLRRRQTS